jgi:hypothetical protein
MACGCHTVRSICNNQSAVQSSTLLSEKNPISISQVENTSNIKSDSLPLLPSDDILESLSMSEFAPKIQPTVNLISKQNVSSSLILPILSGIMIDTPDSDEEYQADS